MVRVPVMNVRTVAARPDLQQRVDVAASPGAFGAHIGQGMQQLGQGMQRTAEVINELEEFKGTLAAKDALTAFERAKTQAEYGPNGYLTKEGSNAANGYSEHAQGLEDLRKQYGQGLTGSAARKYQDASENAVTAGMRTGIIHSAQETKAWAADTAEGRLSGLLDAAVSGFNNPEEVNRSLAAGFAEINDIGSLNGWPPEMLDQKKREYGTKIHTNVALNIANQPNGATAAIQYLEKNQETMSAPQRLELQSKLKPFADEEAATGYVSEILSGRRESSNEPTQIGSTGPTRSRANLVARAASAGKDASHVDGLQPDFAENLNALFEDAPGDIGAGLQIGSGHRTPEHQARIISSDMGKYGFGPADRASWNADVQALGPQAAGEKWRSRFQAANLTQYIGMPGTSNHQHGKAVDVWWNGTRLDKAPAHVKKWVHDNAAAYGLRFPMGHEPWHVEPNGSRTPTGSTVTASRDGVASRTVLPSYSDAMEKINLIEDPNVRASATKQLNAQFEARAKAENAQQAMAKTQLWGMALQGVSMNNAPMDLLLAAGRESVEGFQNYVDNQAKIVTDPVLMRDLTIGAASDPDIFAKIDLMAPEIINRIASSDLQKLVDKQATIAGNTYAAQQEGIPLSNAMSQAAIQLEAAGITTKGNNDNENAANARLHAQFQNALVYELEEAKRVNNGVNVGPAEQQKIINRMLMETIVKRANGGFMDWGTETPGFNFQTGGAIGFHGEGVSVAPSIKLDIIPPAELSMVRATLRGNYGREASDEEVIAYYQRFKIQQLALTENTEMASEETMRREILFRSHLASGEREEEPAGMGADYPSSEDPTYLPMINVKRYLE